MIRRYNGCDFLQICAWLSARNIPCPADSMLPPIGFIESGVACGFLIQTDTDACYFENVYSNQEASKEDRDKAINEIYDAALDAAQALGYKRMLSVTAHPQMIVRAIQRKAIIESNQVLVIKHLNPITDRSISPS